jgi:outer membrane protein assembly factor BamE (lipoprotein component of BamABCDE complex)
MMPRSIILLLAVMLGAGCAPTIANRGMQLDPDRLATLKIGSSTRDSVVNTLGTPSSRSSFNDNVWYYIGRRTEQQSFLDPEIVDQQIVTITFAEDGTVKAIDTTGKETTQTIRAAAGETPSYGTETTWIQDLFGNVGRAGIPSGRGQR